MNLNDMGLSQDEILKKWLIGYKMPPMRIEAHISYFIQKYEVFDAITE